MKASGQLSQKLMMYSSKRGPPFFPLSHPILLLLRLIKTPKQVVVVAEMVWNLPMDLQTMENGPIGNPVLIRKPGFRQYGEPAGQQMQTPSQLTLLEWT